MKIQFMRQSERKPSPINPLGPAFHSNLFIKIWQGDKEKTADILTDFCPYSIEIVSVFMRDPQ
jgi:hypothetical protein